AEPLENALDQVVGEGTLFGRVTQEHANDRPHIRFDVDHKNLVVVPDEQRTTAIGRKDTPNLHGYHVVLHSHSVLRQREKTSPLNTAIFERGMRSGSAQWEVKRADCGLSGL